MAHFVFGTVLVAMLSAPFVAISCSEASAQDRETCLQARSHCGKQPVCQRRYEACLQNWLLDCGASEKMRVSTAIRRMRAGSISGRTLARHTHHLAGKAPG
jgi:GH24 family phage-related lysozyme (muramidase)